MTTTTSAQPLAWKRAGASILVAALALTGCGREETVDAAPEEAQEVAGGEASGTVTVWAMGAEGEKLGELAEGFEAENPDVEVEVTPVPWDAAHDKIATSIAAGETPDVSLVGTTWMGEFAGTGALDPTPDLIDGEVFFEGAWDTTEVDGTNYGVPWYVETRLLYYRTDLAEAAGVEPPTSWEELTEFTTGMQEAGAEYGISLMPGGTGSWQTFMPFAWQNGVELTDGEGSWTLDTPEMQEALTYYASFFDEGISPDTIEPGALEAGFIDGSIGSFISGPWHMGILAEQGGPDFEGKWDVALMPEQESGTSFVGGADLVVFEEAQNRDAAWKFVEYVTRPEVQQEFYGLVAALPSVSSAWEGGELSSDPMLAKFGEQLDDAKSPPAISTWEQVADVIDGEIEKVVLADLDPAEATAAMQAGAESIGTGN